MAILPSFIMDFKVCIIGDDYLTTALVALPALTTT